MQTLLPLYAHPLESPHMWSEVAARGSDLTVVINVPGGPSPAIDPAYAAATEELANAGVHMLGYVDLGYATRPLREMLDEVAHWTGYPVRGVLFDQAPTTPFSIGPVALAVRAAHRYGLNDIVLNPGRCPDPVYRDLGCALAVFEGGWTEYQAWSGHGALPGDGHLVYAVPPVDLPYAQRLAESRGAGFGLVTDHFLPNPYGDLPSWWTSAAAVAR